MISELKRTFQQLTIPQLLLYSTIAASTSIHLTDYHYLIQFTASITASTTIYILNIRVKEAKLIPENLFPIIAGLILSVNFLTSLTATIFILSLFLTPSIFLKSYRIAAAATLSHTADMFSTQLILPKGSELNPLANTLILISPKYGLTILKLFFVVAPVIWSLKNLEKSEKIIFLKLVFILGAGMAIRNLTIFFHT